MEPAERRTGYEIHLLARSTFARPLDQRSGGRVKAHHFIPNSSWPITAAISLRAVALSVSLFFLALTGLAAPQSAQSKKVFIITDMEGVDGVFKEDLEVTPNKRPRWEESLKMFTDEVNAAVTGPFAGGATDVVVWDGHWSDSNLSARDIHPRTRLLTGQPVSPALELDPSYSAVIFIGQHAMPGAEKAGLSHS